MSENFNIQDWKWKQLLDESVSTNSTTNENVDFDDEILGPKTIGEKLAKEVIAMYHDEMDNFTEQDHKDFIDFLMDGLNLKSGLNEKTKVTQDPDVKSKPGTQPSKYYKGLSKSTKEKRASQFKRQTEKPDNDPSAYKKAPGDSKETKPSKHTKKFKDMFGENLKEDIANLIQEDDKVTKALKNKAEKANAPMGALRTIYNKGLAAWKTGHRPGANQHQWAMARVNSVLTGGPARKTDKTQWDQIQKHRKKKK